jgi:tetratricopeptide (TPR) repeat protein
VLGGVGTVEQVEALGSDGAGATLAGLVAAGVLRTGPGSGTVEVVDPTLAEVAYEMLAHDRRAELHRRAAAVAGAAEQAAAHLARAAAYDPDDDVLRAEAARALGASGLALAAAQRPADASRLLARAVELGNRDPAVVLELARIAANDGRADEAEVALAALPGDLPPDAAAERDHVLGAARMFSDPADAAGRLVAVAAEWARLGVTGKEAWAHANAGVALFNCSRMAEAADELERALALFSAAGDRAGTAAATSFLALVRPDDPRVAGWLEEALAFGEESGDRQRQLNALVALAWNHYLRARLGPPEATAAATAFAERLAGVAAEMGAGELEVHGRALAAHLARLDGRLADAESLVPVGRPGVESGAAALAEAVAFSVACAREPRCAAPLPPAGTDPTSAAAFAVGVEALALAGRAEEAHARLDGRGWASLGVVGGGLEVVPALVAVLAGRGPAALPAIERAAAVADRVGAAPAALAARALRAEVTGDAVGLPDRAPAGLAGALVLRARACRGDAAAAADLAVRAAELAAPGLVVGVGGRS